MEPTWFKLTYICVCLFDTCGFHISCFIVLKRMPQKDNKTLTLPGLTFEATSSFDLTPILLQFYILLMNHLQ